MRTRKWSTLLAALVLTTGLSSVVQAADYTQGLTGVDSEDQSLLKEAGNTVSFDKKSNTMTYDFKGQDHTFTVTDSDGISTNTEGDYVFNNVDAQGKKGTLHIYQTNNEWNAFANVTGFSASTGHVTVNSDLDITAYSDYASMGVSAGNGADLVINGNVKMRKDDPSNPWGIITKNVHGNVGPGGAITMDNGYDANYTGARWQPSAFSVGHTRGNITVNGDVDVAVRGTAVNVGAYNAAEGVHPYDLATVSLVGDSTRIITPYREKNSVEDFGEFIEPYYSLACYGGTINVNVKNMEAQKGKVEIVGNIMAMKRSEYTHTSDVYQDSRINLALTTADSSWKGIIDNANMTKSLVQTNPEDKNSYKYDPDATPVYADHSGEVNLWLQNGAQWIYENASRKDGLDYSHMPLYSQPSYGNYDGMSHLSRLVGGKDSASAGIIRVNDSDPIQIAEAEGVTKVWYEHADATPGTIIGGDVKVLNAKTGTEMMLYTGNNGITKGFAEGDAAADKNNVSEVLNSLAHKLWYMAGDSNLKGSVSIAEGLTASSATMKTGNITFAEGGQGFYAYTPEQEKPNYKTGAITKSEDISLSRELDESGVAHVSVTESNAGNNKFASAIYAGESTSSSSPMTVKMSGNGLALNAAQSNGQAAAIYADANTYIKVVNPSADQKLSIRATNTDTRASHGIYALGNAHLNISGPVEITEVITQGDAATGINIQGQQSEITIEGPLTIRNVKGVRERGKGMSASGILVTGDSSTVTVSGPVDISGVRGSGIKLVGANTKVSVGGGTITAAEDSDHSHNFYAVRVDKGTLDINMKDGAAGDTTTKITGDMYATGQYGKKVVEYTGGELIDWNDAGILNVALTDKDSFWKGVAAYDQYNDDYGSGGNTAHDIGQFNLYLQNGATWTNEQQSHVTTTTIASKNPVWAGSTLATLHGGSNAANAGLIYQKDNNPISVVNYSGHTTVFYEHDANDPTKMIGGSFNITNAAEGSAITFITDNKGITSGFADVDSADAKDKVANVLNSLAGKLFYKNYTDGHLSGVVKIAEGLTASSAALKTGDISFSTEDTGTLTPGQGYYDYKTSKPGSQITKEFTTAITGDAAADTVYIEKGVLKDDGTYVFTADSTTITPEKHLIAGGAWLPQISAAISGSDETHNVTMDMNGNKLTVDTTTDTHTTGIAAIGKGVVNINNAGAMSVTATSTKGGQIGALFVNAGGTINIHNAGADNVLTLRAKSADPANAAVIKSMNGVSGVISSITVDGLVDVVADKSNASGANEAISAVASKVEIGGGVIKAINGAEYAIRAYGESVSKNRGQVNVNVKKDAKGAIIGAGSNTVQLEGNVYLGGSMDNAGAKADVSLGLNTKDSFWKGDVSNANGSSAGIVNLYMGNGATWTGNNLSGNTVNANLDHATWTGYSNGNAMHLTLDNSIWTVNSASKLASFSGDKGSIFVTSDAGDISVGDYSGNTTVIYSHDADHPTNILGGSFTIGQADAGSKITLITDNQGITKGFDAYDKAEDQNTVNEVLNKLAQKLFYTANDGKLAGTVKIAEGLTASSKALKTGDISFSTDATGTKTPGQGFYEYTVKDDSVITDPITGNLDKKYVNLGIETEKGIYNFTQDTVIDVTKGDYSSNLSAIESSGGPITIHADGKNLDVSYHVLKGSNVARAVATGLSYGKSKDVTITAKSLKLSTDTTGFYGQGVYATGGKITIDADTTISTSAQTESNGIYSGSGGTVTMNGNLTIQKDSNAANYIALKSDDNGVINVNMKDGKAGAGIVKIDGDVYTKSAETYDYWEEETTSTSSTVNLALQGKDSSWNGRSLYEVTSGDDSTSYGTFNLWLTDGATWTNEKNGKEVPSGFAGSHVTNFTGGSDAAHAGNIFQKDSKNLTIDNYSGNTNIFYAHTGNGEAASDYAAGDTVIKGAAAGSVVSMITDNTGISMNNDASVANVLNALAGKLTYSNFASGEKNLTGYVKIADGLTASSKAQKTGDITFTEEGKGSYVSQAPVVPSKTEFTTVLTGDAATDTEYAGNIQDGKYVFGANTTIKADAESAVDAKTPLTIDAGSNKLILTAKKGSFSKVVAAFNHNVAGTTKITAGELVIGVPMEAYDRSGFVVKNGHVDITAATTTVYAHADLANPAYGILAQNNGSRVDIHGDLKLANDSFGPTHGLWAEDAALYGGKASIINVDGKVDINLRNGNALTAIRTGSTVTVGGGNIQIAADQKNENYALKSDGGVVNVNMNADKNAAGTVTTVVKGNAIAYSEKASKNQDFDPNSTNSTINIGLSDKKSSWTGVAFAKDINSWILYKGIVNLYLANGATWNNEAWGKTNAAFDGSHVAKLAGGASEAAAGNIFQKDSHNLTIDNYSGNTNIFYTHTGNGENASNYEAGDTIIKSAAAGSAVSLITDNTGIAMDNDASVANVLNALAGKLTYSNFVNGEKNLTGYVKIADGLTASSQTKKSDTIKFNSDTGKGYTKEETVNPGGGEKTTFTDAITGEKQGVFSAVQQEDLSYVFAEDASININQMTHREEDPDWEGSFIISGAAVQNAAGVENLVINAADKTLKLNVALDSKTVPPEPNAGILNNRIPLRGIDNSIAGSTTTITAGTLDIDIDNTYSRVLSNGNPMIGAGSAIGIYAKSAGEKAVVEVTGNTVIKAHGDNNVYGVNANGNAEIKLHGDLTMAKDGEEWALDNVIKGQNTTTLVESTWRSIAGINAYGAGASVTVDGKTTIAAHGSGAIAADGATVNLGAADIEVKNNSDEAGYGFHALGAALGTVNVGGEGKTVTVKGNAGLFGKQGQKFASDSKESVINLKMTTDDSAWTGVAYKHFDAEKDAGLSGSMNLTLANGASWNNEKYGYVYGDSEWENYKFTGSEIADFVGGASDAKAGNIFQKDANSLTIDNYSGNTNIFYAHTGNGEAASDYAAGDTVIKGAAAGSVVSMITDNSGINMDNGVCVTNVLKALAGKLTYSNFVNGEKNLTGYVKIADGLTASSAAMQTGNIAFNADTGKGSLENGSMKPGFTYPDTQKPEATEKNQGITGDAKTDYQYKKDGILKEDGSYVFTQDPTKIEVESGAAVEATDKDINIDTTKAKLELKGETGIHANGADVNVNVKGNTSISGNVGINAENGNVTLNGSSTISGTDAAINAGEGANVVVNGNNSALTINGSINADGGNITVDSGKASSTINGDVDAANGGSIVINLTEKNSEMTGGYNVDGDSSIVMNIANGAIWNLTDGDEAAGMSWRRTAKAPAAAPAKGLTINGGKTEAETGYLNMAKRTKALKIANYSGWETIIYGHENAGADVTDYKSGDTIIDKAEKGSGVILSTDNSGIDMKDKNAVEATLKALAQKVTYSDHEANGSNLTGKVQIADGLTASSASKYLGNMRWDENGKGQYVDGSIPWKPTIEEGEYETFVMKGARSAVTTSFHSWRDNMQDTYTGADLADEDGIFAKALGGKTSSDVSGLKDSNSYWGAQIGYDKALANGWHTGVAFDYRDGDSDYLLGGKGDNKLYSFGVYGVKKMEDGSYFRVAAKAGRVENEYDVYTELRNKLHADYKANAYGLTAEYGKTFGSEMSYITPKVQLTWSRVGSKDYTGSANNGATMNIYQDSYDSLVGRLGFEAGMKKAHGSLHAGLYLAHEFNGDIDTRYFAKDGGWKSTSFDGDDTWAELVLGGEYRLGGNSQLYADFARDLGGDFQRKWKLNAGIRLRF